MATFPALKTGAVALDGSAAMLSSRTGAKPESETQVAAELEVVKA